MISDESIERAKNKVKYRLDSPLHQHPDCIRIAYEWLDAQKRLKNPNNHGAVDKHWIEKWAGRYVSSSDVEVAAFMHPDICGKYPFFNISSRLVEPSTDRLKSIPEAFTHKHYRDLYDPSIYKITENPKDSLDEDQKTLNLGDMGLLLCPSCGGNMLNHGPVEVFDRNEDSKSGVHVTVGGGEAIIDSELGGNPAKHRGLKVKFVCSECLAEPALWLYMRKVETYLQFG